MYNPVVTTSFQTTGKLEFRGKRCPGDMVHVPTVTLGKSFIFSWLDNQLGTLYNLKFSLFLKKSQLCLINTYRAPTMFNAILGARNIRRNMTFSAVLQAECGKGHVTEPFNVILQFFLSDGGRKCKWFWGPNPSCE